MLNIKSPSKISWLIILLSSALFFYLYGWLSALLVFIATFLSQSTETATQDEQKQISNEVTTYHDVMTETEAMLSEQLVNIRHENDQILNLMMDAIRQLSQSFHGMSEQAEKINISLAWVDEYNVMINDVKKTLGELKLIVEDSENGDDKLASEIKVKVSEQLVRLDEISSREIVPTGPQGTQLTQLVSEAVVALQFEDMCTQLSVHITKRLDTIDILSDIIRELDIAEQAQNIEHCKALLEKAQTSIQAIKPVIHSVSHQAVSQQNMNTGDVELF